MADILLFGPHQAGKTQLYHTLCKIPDEPGQTDIGDYTIRKHKFWFGKYKIHEIGGNNLRLSSKEMLHLSFWTNNKLVFVFNGNDLINELKDFKQGGYISSLLRCYVMPALTEKEYGLDCQHDIIFIATHEDEYNGDKKDMETEIFSCIEKANEEYRKIANGTRYPFKKLLRSNLFCLDAKNYHQVSEVFEIIKKSL